MLRHAVSATLLVLLVLASPAAWAMDAGSVVYKGSEGHKRGDRQPSHDPNSNDQIVYFPPEEWGSIPSLTLLGADGQPVTPRNYTGEYFDSLTDHSAVSKVHSDTHRRQLFSSFRVLGVGIYVINLADHVLESGSFYADVNLYLKTSYEKIINPDDYRGCGCTLNEKNETVCDRTGCDRICKDLSHGFPSTRWDPNLVNGGQWYTINPFPEQGFYRIQSKWYYHVDLHDWPFDTQRLEIVLEDRLHPAQEMVFCHLPTFSGLAASIRFPGVDSSLLTWDFDIQEKCWPPFRDDGANSEDHCSEDDNRYSRYFFYIHLPRPWFKSFVKVVLPPLFICLVVVATYSLPPKDAVTRVGVCGSNLVAAVLFHVGLVGQLPATGYFTFADRFMIVVYAVIFTAYLVAMVILHLSRKPDNEERTHKVYTYAEGLGWTLSPLLFVFLYESTAVATTLFMIGLLFAVVGKFYRRAIRKWFRHKLGRSNVQEEVDSSGPEHDFELLPRADRQKQ